MFKHVIYEIVVERADKPAYSPTLSDECGCCRIKRINSEKIGIYLDKAGRKRI